MIQTSTPRLMTTARLLSLTVVACILAWVATAGEGLVVVVSALSGWCSDSSTEAQCSSQQSGATANLIIFSVIVVVLGAGLLFIAIRGLARPRVRERWYAAAAVGMLAMPAAAIAGGLAAFHVFSHPGGDQAPGWVAALTIQLSLLAGWALALDRITTRELRRGAPAPGKSRLP
jgi:MFS family permease